MKKLLFLGTLAGILLSGCSQDDQYVNAIPDDAYMIAYIDCNQISEKADFTNYITPEQRASFADMAAIEIGEEDGEFIKQVIMDLDNSGVDTEAPMYFYLDGDMDDPCSVIVAKVSKKDNIDRLLNIAGRQGLDAKSRQLGDFTTINIDDEILVGYSSKTLVMVAGGWRADKEGVLNKALTASQNKRSTPLPDFGNSDLGVYTDMNVLADGLMPELDLDTEYEAMVREWFEGNRQMVTLSFENGYVEMKSKLLESSKVVSEMNELFLPGKVKNEFLKYLPDNVIAAVNIRVDGKKLFDGLCNNKLIRTLLIEELGDERELERNIALARPYVECLNGDLTAGFVNLQTDYWGSPTIDALAMAKVENESIINGASIFLQSEIFTTMDVNCYSAEIDDDYYCFVGQKENMLYGGLNMTPNEYSQSALKARWLGDVKGANYYGVIDLKGLFSMPVVRDLIEEEFYDDSAAYMLANMFDYAYVRDISKDEAVSRIVLQNKDRNSLKVIADSMKPLIMEVVADAL